MTLNSLTILAGRGRDGTAETVSRIDLVPGDTLAVVGPTGSGKSALLSDIEQLAEGDTPTGRRILLDGAPPDRTPWDWSPPCRSAPISSSTPTSPPSSRRMPPAWASAARIGRRRFSIWPIPCAANPSPSAPPCRG